MKHLTMYMHNNNVHVDPVIVHDFLWDDFLIVKCTILSQLWTLKVTIKTCTAISTGPLRWHLKLGKSPRLALAFLWELNFRSKSNLWSQHNIKHSSVDTKCTCIMIDWRTVEHRDGAILTSSTEAGKNWTALQPGNPRQLSMYLRTGINYYIPHYSVTQKL